MIRILKIRTTFGLLSAFFLFVLVSQAERYCVQVLAKCPENCRASEGKHQLPGAKPCLLNLITSEIVIHEK